GPRGRCAAPGRSGPVQLADRGPPGHLAQDRTQPHRAHLREDRHDQPGGREPLRDAAGPAPRTGTGPPLKITKMRQSPHAGRARRWLASSRHDQTTRGGAMSLSGRIFAANYDRLMARTERAGLATQRAALLRGASGEVIEIGGGTGASLPGYGPAVTSLTITEPEAPMVRRLVQRARAQVPAARVLCTVADQPRALRELHRVLRPGGRLLFIEHVRPDEPGLRQWQDRLNWLNRIMAHGCNCNRPTLDTIRAAGFTITGLERSELRDAPPFVRPLVIGTATATGPG